MFLHNRSPSTRLTSLCWWASYKHINPPNYLLGSLLKNTYPIMLPSASSDSDIQPFSLFLVFARHAYTSGIFPLTVLSNHMLSPRICTADLFRSVPSLEFYIILYRSYIDLYIEIAYLTSATLCLLTQVCVYIVLIMTNDILYTFCLFIYFLSPHTRMQAL